MHKLEPIKTERHETVTAVSFPIRLLTFALVLTTVTFAWFGWIIYDLNRDAKTFRQQSTRMEELRGVIVHLDEVLTMSARMAAVTGDSKWEARYRHYETPLDDAIKEIGKFADNATIARAAARTDEANLKLVEMENRAFALVRAGRKDEAPAVLFSPEYEKQKQIYAEGITSFISLIRIEFDERMRANQLQDSFSLLAALAVLGITFVAWLLMMRGLRNWRTQLLGSLHRAAEAEQNLRQLHAELEVRVEARTAELTAVHQELLEVSRQAGMAEVATNVLHNVGNVLNSVNVSTNYLAGSLKKSRILNLEKVVAMLREHEADLGTFMTSDPQGKKLVNYLARLSEHLVAEHAESLKELHSLGANVEHIKEIVAMQQGYAKVTSVKETVKITELVEDSLRMSLDARNQQNVALIREFEDVPALKLEKHKILQILINLVRNAKHACEDSGRADKRVTVRVTNGDARVRISVSDNGVGILPENFTHIFAHGFTTRKNGHGFGLHSGALAAKEMGGSLSVHSEGLGQGAVFTLELPVNPVSSVGANDIPATDSSPQEPVVLA